VRGYGQYCPIARAAEILATRWTLIIVRNMLLGCETFGEIADGAPGIPRSLLSQRLRLLETHGVITRARNPQGRGFRYRLTDAGRDLHETCVVMGAWGTRWLEMTAEELDPYVILWGLCRELDRRDLLPEHRLTVRFELRDGRARHRFWLIAQRPEAEVCVKPPGYDEDLIVRTAADWLARWYTGEVSLGQGLHERRVDVTGPAPLIGTLADWGGRCSLTPDNRARATEPQPQPAPPASLVA
jgi:DNA-binding HxlR family transcriptional regulator